MNVEKRINNGGLWKYIILVWGAVAGVTLAVCGYFIPGNTNVWGNLGNYFGSIIGLLAFAGSIYAIINSNKQARLAEERGSFFKMLDLYQKKMDSMVLDKNVGIDAFKNYGISEYRFLEIYVALIELKENLKMPNSMISFYDDVSSIYRSVPTENECFDSDLSGFIENVIRNKKIDYFTSCYNQANEYSYDIIKSMDLKELYSAMKYISDFMYEKYGHYLGQYFRTICHLQNMIADNIEREKYLAVFRSQLSRYELLILLFNIVSSQIEPEVAQMFVDNEIFKNIFPEDVLGCRYKVDQEKDKDKQREIVNDFIKELVSIKAEESIKTFNK
jgi:hypothetical protein